MMDSEKTKPTRTSNSNLASIITFVSAAIALSLALVALLSGAENGKLQNYTVVMLNTSTVLQNIVKVETASSVTARAALPIETALPTPVINDISLPGISAISSFFASVSSDLTPQATGAASGGALLGDLETFIIDIFGNITNGVGTDIARLGNTLVGDVVSALGVKQWYALYMTELCEGNYEPSYSFPGASMQATSCTPLNQLHANQTNSTLQLGNTVLDFSALNFPNKLGKAGSQLAAIITAIIALQIIGIICCGILIVLLPLNIFLQIFKRWSVKLVIAGLASIATGSFIFVAVVETAAQVLVKDLVNELGDGLGVEAYGGGSLLVLLWLEFIFMATSSTLWFIKWHSSRWVEREKKDMPRPVVTTAKSNYPQGAAI